MVVQRRAPAVRRDLVSADCFARSVLQLRAAASRPERSRRAARAAIGGATDGAEASRSERGAIDGAPLPCPGAVIITGIFGSHRLLVRVEPDADGTRVPHRMDTIAASVLLAVWPVIVRLDCATRLSTLEDRLAPRPDCSRLIPPPSASSACFYALGQPTAPRRRTYHDDHGSHDHDRALVAVGRHVRAALRPPALHVEGRRSRFPRRHAARLSRLRLPGLHRRHDLSVSNTRCATLDPPNSAAAGADFLFFGASSSRLRSTSSPAWSARLAGLPGSPSARARSVIP